MKIIFKTVVIIVAFVLLVSSSYTVFYMDSEEKESNDTNGDNVDNEAEEGAGDNEDNNNNNNNENGGTNSGNTGSFDTERAVFIEEATYTTCKNCAPMGDILHELYESQEYPIYYVSLILDEPAGKKRLEEELNAWGYPTIYIDGGYEIVFGKKDKSVVVDRIKKTLSREVPAVYVNVTASWKESQGKIYIDVKVKNNDSETYTGFLRVYLTEIISTRWNDYDIEPYHLGFLEFAIDESLEISPNQLMNFTKTLNDSDFNPENLMIFAVVFNSETVKTFSDPKKDGGMNNHPFDAHYADAVDAARVLEGSLPPTIGITQPKRKTHYRDGEETGKVLLLGKTTIVGPITIKANVQSEVGVEKVEFTIKKGIFGEVTEIDTTEPYEWTWNKIAIGRYTIIAKLYDKEGKTATDSVDVIVLILNQ